MTAAHSTPAPSASSPPPTTVAQLQQRVMQVYREELALQHRLSAQCRTLHQLADATTGVVQWWRRGAATAAAAEAVQGTAAPPRNAGTKRPRDFAEAAAEAAAEGEGEGEEGCVPVTAAPPPEPPTPMPPLLTRHPGMVFYSLGELLHLWATTAAARGDDAALLCWRTAATSSTAAVDASLAQPGRQRPRLPPWVAGLDHGLDPGGQPSREPRLRLPTPAQLLRHRLCDAHCPLAVTHPLLLGSVPAPSAEVLLRWLMRLTHEGAAALLQHDMGRDAASATPALALCAALTRLLEFVEALVAGRAGAARLQWRLAAAQRPHLRHGLRLLFEEVGAIGQAALEAATSGSGGPGDAAWRAAMERLAGLSAHIVEREGACLDAPVR